MRFKRKRVSQQLTIDNDIQEVRWRGGIYLHIHFCPTRGPACCPAGGAAPAPAIRTLARVLIQSFHDCAALAALRVPGSPLTVNIYSGHNYLHTQSALHWCRAATLTWAPGTAWTWCWFGSVGAGICNGAVLAVSRCRYCPSAASPGARGGVVRGGGRGAAVLRRVRLVRGWRRARRREDGGQLRGLALDLLYILCSNSSRF